MHIEIDTLDPNQTVTGELAIPIQRIRQYVVPYLPLIRAGLTAALGGVGNMIATFLGRLEGPMNSDLLVRVLVQSAFRTEMYIRLKGDNS